MKQIKLLYILIVLGFASLSGCSPSSGTSSPAPIYSMKATIGSTSFNVTMCNASIVGTDQGISGITVVGGTPVSAPQINLNVYPFTGATGTYPMTTSTVIANSTFGNYNSAIGAMTQVSK